MTKTTRCYIVDCRKPVTHTVQRLWQIPGRAPFGLQYCCDDHIPGSAAMSRNEVERRLKAAAPLSRFYRVEKITDAA